MEKYDSIKSGELWLDTEGKPIHAHGGSIMYIDGVYYWYGENKEKSTKGSGIWHWGVRCYKSTDLYNWEDLGLILPPNTEDPEDPLYFSQGLDRPHIIYNEKTKKYVMWFKVMKREDFSIQYYVTHTADSITGPYSNRKVFHPYGFSSGDFDLVIDEETKDAYIYFEKVHSCMICARLTDDYTECSDEYVEFMPEKKCPFVKEAPAFFKHDGKMFLFASYTTGYMPNPTESYESDGYFGEWKAIGRPHVNDTENLSFRSQICSVFKHPEKKNLYIALADRWLTLLPKDVPNNILEIIINICCGGEKLVSDEEWKRIVACKLPQNRDTSLARYVWLPIVFEDGKPKIYWHDSWKIEDYE